MTKDKFIAAMLVEGERRVTHCEHCNCAHRHDLGCPGRREDAAPVDRNSPLWRVGEETGETAGVPSASRGTPATAATIDSGEVKNAPVIRFPGHDGRPVVECPCGALKVNEWGFDPVADCIVCGRPDPRRLAPVEPPPAADTTEQGSAAPNHFDANPRPLCPDPVLGTRAGWSWCSLCFSIQAPNHIHYREEE